MTSANVAHSVTEPDGHAILADARGRVISQVVACVEASPDAVLYEIERKGRAAQRVSNGYPAESRLAINPAIPT